MCIWLKIIRDSALKMGNIQISYVWNSFSLNKAHPTFEFPVLKKSASYKRWFTVFSSHSFIKNRSGFNKLAHLWTLTIIHQMLYVIYIQDIPNIVQEIWFYFLDVSDIWARCPNSEQNFKQPAKNFSAHSFHTYKENSSRPCALYGSRPFNSIPMSFVIISILSKMPFSFHLTGVGVMVSSTMSKLLSWSFFSSLYIFSLSLTLPSESFSLINCF